MRRLPLLLVAALGLMAPLPAHAKLTPRSAARPAVTIASEVARRALRYRGVPYVWGGTTSAGFDCSGFTRYLYAQFGIQLPHSSYAQWNAGRHISRSELRPGDIVFFGLGHVGLWLGHGRFIHAPHTGATVSVASIDTAWYADSYIGAMRPPRSQHTYHPATGMKTRATTARTGTDVLVRRR